MSFIDAEAEDADLNDLSLLVRNALFEGGYARNQNQAFDNLNSDPLIPDTAEPSKPGSRLELLQFLSPHRTDLAQMRTAIRTFGYARQGQGPFFVDAAVSTFGRVCRFDAIANAIAASDSSLSLEDARALLQDAINDTSSATKLARQRADLAGRRLSSFQMWAFPIADAAAPFAEIGNSRHDAVNILGLGHFGASGDELVRFAHELSASVHPHIPTAWDADCSVYWRIGGRTFLLDRAEYGLREVVHAPITGDNLVTAIETLT